MINSLKRATLALSLVAAGFMTATTAEARDRYDNRGNDAAIAIGAGIIDLAIGSAIADRDDRYYYDRAYYPQRRYVRVRGRPDYYYYYDNAPKRYYRDRNYNRDYQGWYGGRNYNRWDRGQQRVNRWYGRDRDRYNRDRRNDYYYRRGY